MDPCPTLISLLPWPVWPRTSSRQSTIGFFVLSITCILWIGLDWDATNGATSNSALDVQLCSSNGTKISSTLWFLLAEASSPTHCDVAAARSCSSPELTVRCRSRSHLFPTMTTGGECLPRGRRTSAGSTVPPTYSHAQTTSLQYRVAQKVSHYHAS